MIQEHSCSKNGALLVLGLQACCNMLGGEEHRATTAHRLHDNSHDPGLSGWEECCGLQLTWILSLDILPSCKITLTRDNSKKPKQVSVTAIHDASETRNLDLCLWQWVFACKNV